MGLGHSVKLSLDVSEEGQLNNTRSAAKRRKNAAHGASRGSAYELSERAP
jgi:hypothetical protein